MPEVKQPMQVEVIVQDYYFGAEQGLGETVASAPNLPVEAAVPWSSWFCRWLEHLQPQLSPQQSYELSLRLTTDAEIQALNAQYRQYDQPTDVLAFAALEVNFPHSEVEMGLPLYLGDIVISIDTAQRQAERGKHALTIELAWLASHGLLHLLGWDHPDPGSLALMLQQQQQLLATVALDLPIHSEFII